MSRYRRIRIVGKGSFGCCWLVENELGEQCILKQIDVSKMPAKQKEEAANEVKVLSKLRHPFIINYKESYVNDGLLCIITDYAEKGDLYKVIHRQKRSNELLSEGHVLRWFTQIALALKHMHDRHILHRDLKTQNIFLSGPGLGTVKMGDFGIARVLQHTQDCARTAIGTPYYLSPEICQEKPYNHKSDIWSLGCILYELATLQHAFDADSMRGLVMKILKGVPPQVPSTFSAALRDLVSELLTKDPHSRPSIDEVLRRPVMRGMIRHLLHEVEACQQGRRNAGRSDTEPCRGNPERSGDPAEAHEDPAFHPMIGQSRAASEAPLVRKLNYSAGAAQEKHKANEMKDDMVGRAPAPQASAANSPREKPARLGRGGQSVHTHEVFQQPGSQFQRHRSRMVERCGADQQQEQQQQRRQQPTSQQQQQQQQQPQQLSPVSPCPPEPQQPEPPQAANPPHAWPPLQAPRPPLPPPKLAQAQHACSVPRTDHAKDRGQSCSTAQSSVTAAQGQLQQLELDAHREQHPKCQGEHARDGCHLNSQHDPAQGQEYVQLICTLREGLDLQAQLHSARNEEDAAGVVVEGASVQQAVGRPQFLRPDGKVLDLPVGERDSLSYRIEALKVYLEQEIGLDSFLSVYWYLNNSVQNEALPEKQRSHPVTHLDSSVAPESIKFLPLVHQLIVCEDRCFGN